MTSLTIEVDDVDLTLCTEDAPADETCAAGQPDTVSMMIDGIQCGHCGGGMEELHAPLTCGCAICNCLCPCWHDCPKFDREEEEPGPDAPQTEMKKE